MNRSTDASELEWRKFDCWGSISGTSLKGTIENGTSRSLRCFQVKIPSEQLFDQNYYAGTGANTPGPGSYSDTSTSSKNAPSFCFGSSNRALSESGRLWASNDCSVPPPGTYDVDKSSRTRYLQDLCGVTNWKIKAIKRKIKVLSQNGGSICSVNMLKAELKFLVQRAVALKEEIQLTNLVSEFHKPKITEATKPGFNSTGKKFYQEVVAIQEAPTFYMAESDWDFGSDKRSSTTDMAAFNYGKNVLMDQEREVLQDVETLVGVRRSKARCRNTDFFGPNADFRSITPGVGQYTPPLVPSKACDLGQHRYEQQVVTDAGTSTTKWTKRSGGKYSFTFSRSCTVERPITSASSVTSELTIPSTFRQSTVHNHKAQHKMGSTNAAIPLSPVKPQGRR